MNMREQPQGASSVGNLSDIASWEADLILSVRLWMDSPDGQAEVWNSFAQTLGPSEGREELRHFEMLLSTLCRFSRRPLVRHGLGCMCIGSDEAVLRTLVREAARGEIAEAAMIASLIVPAGQAERVALHAARVGQTLQRMSHSSRSRPSPNSSNGTPRLH